MKKSDLQLKLKDMEEKFNKYKKLLDAAAKATSCLVSEGYGDKAFHKAMEYLGLATDADRVSIFEGYKDATGERFISQRYEWSRHSVEPQIDNPELQNLPADQIFPGWIDRNERGEASNEIVRYLSPQIKSVLEPQGILSILIVPVLIEGKSWGTIGFDDCHRERLWDESEIGILSAVAGTIGVGVVRKKAEEEKIKMEVQLRHAQKLEAIGTLAGGISHDFNNILAAITGYAELSLCQLPEKSRVKGNLHHILKGCNRAKNLIEQILTFSRQTEQKRKPVNITPIIKEVLKFLRATFSRTIAIKKEILLKNFTVIADPTEIYQLLMNLTTNAAQAIGDRSGEINISIKEMEESETGKYRELKNLPYICLTVSDNGCGIEKEHLDRIFEPFFTTKKPGKGTGLGLSVVYGIVKSMEGIINVNSKHGEGSTFQIILPGLNTVTPPSEEENWELTGGNEHILFIDDEKEIVKMEKNLLEVLGYKVTAVDNSLKALEIFKENPNNFDVILTDYIMPHMTGLQLAEEIMKIRNNIPVIMCTGYSEHPDREKFFRSGISEILFKPVNIHNIAGVLRKTLSVREKKQILKGDESILFIDDEKDVIDINKFLLEKLGYKVTASNKSLEGLELFKKEPAGFDLVITDYMMPDMTGIELSEEIMNIRPDMPVILCTGYSKNLNMERSKKSIKKILQKPLNIHSLSTSIQEVIEESKKNNRAQVNINYDIINRDA
jgi:signal transduction histidine kinase/response regulator RpfG family c-di-GMP phosphodiesterase